MIDETHDRARQSWVASANGHAEFPLQNLPFGVFSPAGGAPRGGIAIGDDILDVAAAPENSPAACAARRSKIMSPIAMPPRGAASGAVRPGGLNTPKGRFCNGNSL